MDDWRKAQDISLPHSSWFLLWQWGKYDRALKISTNDSPNFYQIKLLPANKEPDLVTKNIDFNTPFRNNDLDSDYNTEKQSSDSSDNPNSAPFNKDDIDLQ